MILHIHNQGDYTTVDINDSDNSSDNDKGYYKVNDNSNRNIEDKDNEYDTNCVTEIAICDTEGCSAIGSFVNYLI